MKTRKLSERVKANIIKARFHKGAGLRGFIKAGGYYVGLTYQSCRFCKRASHQTDEEGLFKYGPRHYICSGCRKEIIGEVPHADQPEGQ